MGLRETLEAATPGPWEHRGLGLWGGDGRCQIAGWARHTAAPDFDLAALAPELAAEVLELRERHREAMALALDMGDYIRRGHDEAYVSSIDEEALLARLDQLGKEHGDE